MYFIKPKFFNHFIPKGLPKLTVNYIAGGIEFLLGIGLFFPSVSYLAAIGIFILLMLFLPIHIWDATKVRPAIGSKKLAYISDISDISNKNLKYFKNLKYLIIDCLWYNFHPSHFNLEKSLFFIKKFEPKKAILTNLSPVLDYNELKKKLPKNVVPAHDGLTINL